MSTSSDSIGSVLQQFVNNGVMAGAVALVATAEKVLAVETVGYADLTAKKPMTPDTVFWIASISKPITATAFMMLIDEGKVNVDDPVEKYLPEFKGQMVVAEKDEDHILLKKPAHPILVREILSHTAGLHFCSAMETPTFDRLPLEHAVRSHAISPLVFEPGTQYAYSNAGTNTAGRIIEVVSGMSYEEFMDKRLFKPLGMKDTTFRPNEEQISRLAKSYKRTAPGLKETLVDQLSYPLNNPGRQPIPAGGLFSTLADIAKFCQMILNDGINQGTRCISHEAIKQMTSRQTGSVGKDYGFGWGTGPDGRFGHGGAYKTEMTINPQLGLITIFLVQRADDWAADGGNAYATFVSAAEKLLAGNR